MIFWSTHLFAVLKLGDTTNNLSWTEAAASSSIDGTGHPDPGPQFSRINQLLDRSLVSTLVSTPWFVVQFAQQ